MGEQKQEHRGTRGANAGPGEQTQNADLITQRLINRWNTGEHRKQAGNETKTGSVK